MGKRKNKDKDQDYIKKKIRKLERKLAKMPVEVDSGASSPRPQRKLERKLAKMPVEVDSGASSPRPQSPFSPALLPSVAQPIEVPSPPAPNISAHNDVEQELTEDNLPEELLQALGNEGEENTEVGEAIRPELALRWTRILQTGLGKESREAICKKYPTPINFPRAVAPLMNAEISASLSNPTLKRDTRISYRQNLTGKLMTCLGKSLTKVLMGNISSKGLVEEMSDAAKLAAEIYHQDSSSRTFFALAGVNKVVQDAVKTATPDETLFGIDCAEKIRAAQAIQKAGSMIKTTEKKTFKPGTQKKQLNWRGPPQYQQQQRARGGHQHQRQPRPDQTRWKTQKPAPSSSKSRFRR